VNPTRSPKANAAILFSHASNGVLKAVVLSHENIQANRFQVATLVAFNSRDVVVAPLPLHIPLSLTMSVLHPLFSGIKLNFYPFPQHYRIVPEIIYEMNATLFFVNEPFTSAYAHHANPECFYNLRMVFSVRDGSEKGVRQYWQEKFGIRILETWGAPEVTSILMMNTPLRNKQGTLGRFLPGVEYKLEAVPGIENGGRLWVAGPQVAQGYLLSDTPGKFHPFTNGWFDTGKIVSIDDEGFVSEYSPTN
jgi:acyl-[acyl-carrier-protein]-phospholipid O-acyltransferase/long-chain-fatty-acid--[acyl-carrier-protein] ligase